MSGLAVPARRARDGFARGDRGAVLLEFAFVLPLLALMAFGIVEFGRLWQDRSTVQAAARSGARVGSSSGSIPAADRELLLGVGAVLYDVGVPSVNWVLVYKSTTADGAVPVACTTPTPQGVSGSCNAYSGAQLQQIVDGTAPASWFGCGPGSLDLFWCPTTRQTIQANGTDYLGVWVSVRRPMLTGFFGSVTTITDQAVMRLEPKEA
ncbi:MAG: pilus assembly protein [Actinomycetota bacterium]|nr:pilus assembly protein [Actinomycetota bacterium]